MTPKRFRRLLDAYGADPARWPAEDAPAIQALLDSSEQARTMQREAARVDDLLEAWDGPGAHALDAADMAALVSATPHGATRPVAYSDGWRITLGWPNVAGLAAACVAGFVVGVLGVADPWLFAGPDMIEPLAELTSIGGALW